MTDRRRDAARAHRTSGGEYRPAQASISHTIVDAETCSLKRLAWAYGCAPKGSPEERQLGALLLERVSAELVELGATWATIASEAIVEGERLRSRIDAV